MEVLSLSDADDQMGGTGTGGDTGPRPGGGATQDPSGQAKGPAQEPEDDAVTEESKDSFPASDPPANY